MSPASSSPRIRAAFRARARAVVKPCRSMTLLIRANMLLDQNARHLLGFGLTASLHRLMNQLNYRLTFGTHD